MLIANGSRLSRSAIAKAFSGAASRTAHVSALRGFHAAPLALNCLHYRPLRLGNQTCTSLRAFSSCSVRLDARNDSKAIKLSGSSVTTSKTTTREQRKKDWLVVRKLLENVWPKNDWGTRGRVILGFALLISGKV